MLKIKNEIPLSELEKFGFEEFEGHYYYLRELNNIIAWRIDITNKHHYLQITVFEPCKIVRSLQSLIYDLI